MKIFKSKIPDLEIHLEENDIVIISKNHLEALSNAVINGGRVKTRSIVNHHVPLDFQHTDLKNVFNSVKKKFNLSDSMIGLLTAVYMKEAVYVNESVDDINYLMVVTAGISNTSAPYIEDSHLNEKSDIYSSNSYKPGTINIILIIDGKLTEHAMTNLFITITEAKTLLFHELDIKTKDGRFATGTSTDTITVACTGKGKVIEWVSYATKFGQSIGKTTYKALFMALEEKVGDPE